MRVPGRSRNKTTENTSTQSPQFGTVLVQCSSQLAFTHSPSTSPLQYAVVAFLVVVLQWHTLHWPCYGESLLLDIWPHTPLIDCFCLSPHMSVRVCVNRPFSFYLSVASLFVHSSTQLVYTRLKIYDDDELGFLAARSAMPFELSALLPLWRQN